MAIQPLIKDPVKQKMAAIIVLATIGILCFVGGISQKAKYANMSEWPVIQAGVKNVHENLDENSKVEDYTFGIEYSVDGNSYGRSFTTFNHPGEKINVVYNPNKPGEVYLANNLPSTGQWYIIGIVFLGLGAICVPAFLKEKKA